MAIILFGFAIAAILWSLITLQRFGMLGVGLLTLAAGVCFGAPFFSVASLTADRLMVCALLGFYLVAHHSEYFKRKPVCGIDWMGLALLAWILLSAISHDWRLGEAQPLKNFVFYYALPAAMYWLARETPLSESSTRKMFLALAGFGLYLAITAIAEWRDCFSIVFPRYIASAEFEEFFGRGRGPLLNPSGNGILLCLSLAAAALCWPQANRRGRSAIAVALPIICVGIFATLTRCVWVGGVLGVLTLIMTTVPTRYRGQILGISAMIVLTVLVANKDRLNNFKRDKGVTASDMSKSASLRPMLANVAWGIFQDQPFVGVGFGQYKEVAQYYHSRDTDFARPYIQHNIFLSLLTETGLVGMLLLINLLVAWARAAWYLWNSQKAPLPLRQIGVLFAVTLLAYLANGMFQDVTIVPMVHMVLAYFAGLTVGQYLLLESSMATTASRPAHGISRRALSP